VQKKGGGIGTLGYVKCKAGFAVRGGNRQAGRPAASFILCVCVFKEMLVRAVQSVCTCSCAMIKNIIGKH